MRISVIVPAFNEEAVIGRCLEALVGQTSPVDEILVVDNNSTDGTAEVAARFEDRGVRVVREPRQGLIPARNRGFDEATGDVLGRIDADTVVERDWSQRLREAAADPTVSAVTGPSWFYDAPLPRANLAAHRLFCHRVNRVLSGYPMLWGSNMALTRECWQELREHVCPGPDIFEDLDLAIHLHRLGRRVHYAKSLRTSVSARRVAGSPREVGRYLRVWPRTFRMHGERRAAAGAWAIHAAVLVPAQPALAMVLRAYTPDQGTLSLGRLFSSDPAVSRPIP
ncbi:glycosyltransferase family 2 protein [Marinitenerispora sediminis]|uniref:Glycosyltransferase family 2 protein n=1 Tax=Marinitenerispora sediminis TaxID=1931232 RepID=A0A368T4K6_9ACTN|nr:glycosyltransferase family 2 protein [Marinitenerispora sediminis]RCV51957.1 glycosyltransferase family 2 protein [Marinitenerispora sediminis]RCV55399.1 glycosyltransferase family 2 protein [Marinitenerispora sediminis]RCV58198.1 glycosyltransferase family 2 protein [Marinitenerispora sediminis]